jgi:hypothetical protein
MQNSRQKSDIEQILEAQTWKYQKLAPLTTKQRSVKLRSITEPEKPRKQERIITQPITLPESLMESPTPTHFPVCRAIENRKSLSSLAVPFSVITSAISSISSRALSFDFQVPLFPKREFGKLSKDKEVKPKFERVQSYCSIETIKELKCESGRIRKNSVNGTKKRFQFLDDFNKVTSAKAIKRMKTVYFGNE